MRSPLRPLLLLAALAPAASAQSQFWLQNADGQGTLESSAWSSPSTVDREAADDFEFTGDVTRVRVFGHKSFSSPGTLAIEGVWVRFYAEAGGSPGALQHEVFVPEGSSAFVHQPYPSQLDVTLPVPFEATGRHFVSVQLVTPSSHSWRIWTANTPTPTFAPAHVKDDVAGTGWQVYTSALGNRSDLAFELWGDDGTPIDDPVDPCGPWQTLATPDLPDNYSTTILRDLVAIADDDVWAVGNPSVEVQFLNFEMKTLAMHWDGDDWTIVPTPNPGVMPEPFQQTGLRAVDATGADDVWAVGSWERQDALGFIIDQPLVLRRDGDGWDHLVAPNSNSDRSTYDVKAFRPDDVWVAGGGFSPWTIRWDGSGFEAVPVPAIFGGGGTPGFDFTAIDGVASDDLWAVGGGSDGDFTGTNVIAHWDGSDWTAFDGPTPGFARRLFDVHALAPDDVFATGQYQELVGGFAKYFGYVIHWDGSSWTQVGAPGATVGGGAIHAFATDEVYTAGSNVYRWDGASWSVADDLGQLTGENLSVSVAGLDAASPCTLYAVGRRDSAGQLVPFAARQQGPDVWATTPLACDDAPGVPDGLALLSGPKLGTPFRVAVGDPTGSLGLSPATTVTFWALAVGAPLPACSVTVPGAGVAGDAALFVEPSALAALSGPLPWGGVGAAATHSIAVPADPAFAGLELATQGVLLDPTQPFGLKLTDGLAAVLGE